jgi:molybdopterin converting factor subunit 1
VTDGGGVRVEVLLFARLREVVGQPSAFVSVASSPASAGDVWRALVAAHPRLGGADSGLRVAVNQSYAEWDTPVAAGDVVAFIPPVAGGSGRPGVHVRLTTDPLDPREVEALVRTDEDGAVCTFIGVVRNHADGHPVTDMDYEAYPGMAEAEMERIAREAVERFGVTAVAAVHRLGRLAIGDASVVVSVSAHHRGAAFDACQHTMDTLKAEVPIWKKEHGPDGSEWVDERLRQH